MPFDQNPITGRNVFSFPNFLATLVIVVTSTYFFWISLILTKTQVADNPTLQQITIVMVTMTTLVLNYYFGSSSSASKQAQQITDMQKKGTDTIVQVTKAAAADRGGPLSPAAVDIKVDKAVKIEQLKAALEKLDPDSDDAKKIVAELEELEKQTN